VSHDADWGCWTLPRCRGRRFAAIGSLSFEMRAVNIIAVLVLLLLPRSSFATTRSARPKGDCQTSEEEKGRDFEQTKAVNYWITLAFLLIDIRKFYFAFLRQAYVQRPTIHSATKSVTGGNHHPSLQYSLRTK
jgi:hypothetical protein